MSRQWNCRWVQSVREHCRGPQPGRADDGEEVTGDRQERRGNQHHQQHAGAGEVAGSQVDQGGDEHQQAQLDRVVEPVERHEAGQPQSGEGRPRGLVVAASSDAGFNPAAARDTWTMSFSDLLRMITTASRRRASSSRIPPAARRSRPRRDAQTDRDQRFGEVVADAVQEDAERARRRATGRPRRRWRPTASASWVSRTARTAPHSPGIRRAKPDAAPVTIIRQVTAFAVRPARSAAG